MTFILNFRTGSSCLHIFKKRRRRLSQVELFYIKLYTGYSVIFVGKHVTNTSHIYRILPLDELGLSSVPQRLPVNRLCNLNTLTHKQRGYQGWPLKCDVLNVWVSLNKGRERRVSQGQQRSYTRRGKQDWKEQLTTGRRTNSDKGSVMWRKKKCSLICSCC